MLNLSSFISEAFIQTKVSFDQKIDSLGNDFFILTVEHDGPDQIGFLQLIGVYHNLETRILVFLFGHLFSCVLAKIV